MLVAIGAMAVGAALQAYGQWKAGEAAKRNGEMMAKEFERMASDRLRVGQEDAFVLNLKARANVGSVKAAFGASGTDAEEATITQTRIASEIEIGAVRTAAQREAWGLRRRAMIARQQGAEAATAAKGQAAGTLIGATVGIAGMAYTPGGRVDVPYTSKAPGAPVNLSAGSYSTSGI